MRGSLSGKKVIIIGAGLSGSLASIYLARRGCEVEIFERRPDMRGHQLTGARSINMTLAARGLAALKQVMDLDLIFDVTIPLKGRVVHNLDGSTKFIPYGTRENEVIYAIKRKDLNRVLMDVAESTHNVKIHFDERCSEMDKTNGRIHLVNEKTGAHQFRQADFIIGADGTFSTVRQQMHRGERANYQQEFLDCGYKEITLPPGPNKTYQLDQHVLHVWPRGGCMLMGIPNLDSSFALTCIMPFSGRPGFDSLTTEAEVMAYFNSQFRDVVPLIGPFASGFLSAQPAMFPTTKVAPWHYRGQVLLIGDACHTVTPFYGQGMNAAFEDCAVLDECLDQNGDDFEAAFSSFQALRKRNTDALADLSVQNFLELRDKVRSPMLLARKQLDSVLHKLLGDSWMPLYTLIAHTNIPYADALDQYKRQCRRGQLMGLDVALGTLAGCIYGEKVIRSFFRGADQVDDLPVIQPLPNGQEDHPLADVEELKSRAAEAARVDQLPRPNGAGNDQLAAVKEFKSAVGMRRK
ncbi:MAG TPA: NAD(P)/FAD-dependent oxidoreductase [Pyrinomonadaceae bacterium]